MSFDGQNPPARESVYPEPYRAPGWQPDAPVRKSYAKVWIAVGAAALVLILVGVVGVSWGRSIGTATPTIADLDGELINAIQAEPGMCLEDVPGDGSVAQVNAMPCSVPHRAEVVASYVFAGDAFPGRDQVTAELLAYCGDVVQPGFDSASMFQPNDWNDGVRWVAWVPTEDSWSFGEAGGVCVAYRDADMVGSFVAGTVTFVD